MNDERRIISHLDFKVFSTEDITGKQHNTEVTHKPIEKCYNEQSICVVDNIKKIIIKSTTVRTTKAKNGEKNRENGKKRVVSKTDEWKNIDTNHREVEKQYKFIEDPNNISDIVSRELRKKISSYKSQDRRKNIYNDDEFIDFEFVINLFKETQLKCYYCDKQVFVIYDNVLESKQWTIERIDNRIGHNKNNSVMACLDCNLRRRCMYHERYIMTKKLSLVKLS
jgi:hypothetical protein